MTFAEWFGILPKRIEDCPACKSGRTGIVLYRTGDDMTDIRRAAKRGYYVHHLEPGEPMEYDRFCVDCGYVWNHADVPADVLSYDAERPVIDYEKHSKRQMKKIQKEKARNALSHRQ